MSDTSSCDRPSDSTFIGHEPCPVCGSSNNLARYSDGHGHCFGCQHYERGDGQPREHKPRAPAHPDLVEIGTAEALPIRALTQESCEHWGYTTSHFAGKACQIANYRDESGQIIAQKIRMKGKEFKFIGDTKSVLLYGQHLWRDRGKMVVVVEGEIDAISVSQIQGHKWPVVSLPNGAAAAEKAIKKSLDWLEGFESVIFMFDSDEPGIEAARKCAAVLSPGKAKIARLPLKDANDMLKAGRTKEVIDAIWGAKTFRPDGIVAGVDLWESVRTYDTAVGIPYPWTKLTEKTRGLRKNELVTFCAGSGIGKSAVCREIAHHLMKHGETVGYIALEESTQRTALGLVGIELNRPLHISREGVTDEQLREAFAASVGNGRTYLYDHFGSIDSGNLLSRIRYLARAAGCGWIVLDHISIVVSGIGDGDERRLIDNTMTSLRSLVQETGVGLLLVSHLKRPEGRGHEEGAQTSLGQLRGSAAIGQLSDLVIGLERDQQDEESRNITTLRVLKNRHTGVTGEAGQINYNPDTGRLTEHSGFEAESDEEAAF